MIDLDPVFDLTMNQGEIVATRMLDVWATLCGHTVTDNEVEERIANSIRSKLREGYFTIHGHPEYVFFLGIDGKVYPHNYPSTLTCRGTDPMNATNFGNGPPHWTEILLSVVQRLVQDWYVENLKKGHQERVKDRAINLNKQG